MQKSQPYRYKFILHPCEEFRQHLKSKVWILLEHARTASTGKFKILKLGCTLIFSLPVSCQLKLFRNAEAGHSGSRSELTHLPVPQSGFSPCGSRLEECKVYSSGPGTQWTLQEKTSLQFIQWTLNWRCCGKHPFRFMETGVHRKII